MRIKQITDEMLRLEVVIARQQRYINQHSVPNDAQTDACWEAYKRDAAYNLAKWDALKIQRDALKEDGQHSTSPESSASASSHPGSGKSSLTS